MYSTNQPNSAAPQHYGQQGLALGVPITSQKHQYPPQGYMQPAEKGPWSTVASLFDKLLRSSTMEQPVTCGATGTLYALIAIVTGCGCLNSCFYRSRLRNEYMLEEKPCNDCCLHFCCECCALCQEHRALTNRGFQMSL
ncbi:hypothetical protein Godav_019719, partial [Gossypium davidsonii]|nr:hypothetical protein [Gossypium davidsonii]